MTDQIPIDFRQNTYAKYDDLPLFSYKCVKFLTDYNQTIWKLLKYNDNKAYEKPDLSYDEKIELIYRGQEDASQSRVFMDIGQPDVWVKEATILRISPHSIHPDNFIYGTLAMSFEIYSHNKINQLYNYQTRTVTIAHEILKVFNGREIAGIGRLHFNVMVDQSDRLYQIGQLPFKGIGLILSNKSL